MTNLLNNFEPDPILISFSFVTIYWYGVFLSLAVIFACIVIIFLGKKYKINTEDLFNLSFYLIIFGLIGTRVYHVFLEWQYYLSYPVEIIKVWNGGLAIHGGLLTGIVVLYFFVKKNKVRGLNGKNFWENFISLSFIVVPAVALGQAIGRWGNYFNQELFGSPTNLPWGININILNRPIDYISYQYFHPTFLYESLASFFIFIFLIFIHLYFYKKNRINFKLKLFTVSAYLILYSVTRFFLEFIRIDPTPAVLGLRFPQIVSLIIILVVIYTNYRLYKKRLI